MGGFARKRFALPHFAPPRIGLSALLPALLLIALLVIAHLASGRIPTALDAQARQAAGSDRANRLATGPAPYFPGSAFFYAEGAFAPAPDAGPTANAHLLLLERTTAAPVWIFRGATPLDSYRALNCLTSAIYYEGAQEPDEGQQAIAQVILNRVRNAAWPHSICGVVYQGAERSDLRCQFSFACDGAMTRTTMTASWARARRAAAAALAGRVFAPVGLATYYHTLAVRPPWAATLQPVAVVGAHIFYRQRGPAGTMPAFGMRYTGLESQPAPMSAPMTLVVPPLAVSPDLSLPGDRAIVAPPVQSHEPQQRQDADLPESTIRPEWRNSGRPLQQ